MTRISKQGRRRALSPRKHRQPSIKTGPKKDNLQQGYKYHENTVTNNPLVFIAKIK